MSWFRKKKATVTLPFPAERLSVLATIIIPAAISRGITLRQDESDLADRIWSSRFLNSYICSYPDYLDERLPHVGGIARFTLISTLLAKGPEEAQLRVNAFKEAFQSGDPLTRKIAVYASDDGSNYFRALMEGRDADDTATTNLILAIRTMHYFDPLALERL